MPKKLEPGVLYVSEEFGAVAHLCPCGCGSKIRTPLGPTEWSLKVTRMGPSLFPSIGNWQLPCKSHYWIKHGKIIWASSWTPEQIATGRHNEEERRHAYYGTLVSKGRCRLFQTPKVTSAMLRRKLDPSEIKKESN
jgi:hypothetical protein